jgi:phage gp36-like protein
MAQPYATTADFGTYGIPSAAQGSQLNAANIAAAILSASTMADGYLASQYTLPLSSWGSDLRKVVCALAAWELMAGVRGFNPEGSDSTIRQRYDDATDWLRRVASGQINPPDIIDRTPSFSEGMPLVASGVSGNSVGPGGASATGFMNGIPYQPLAYPYTPGSGGRRGW